MASPPTTQDKPAASNTAAPAEAKPTSAPPQPSAATRMGTAAKRPVEAIGRGTIFIIESMGKFTMLFFEMLAWTLRPPYRPRQLLLAMDFVGFGSLFIVLLTGFFTGAVFAYQSAYAFRLFSAESLVGATVALAITRELGPVLTGLMVTGRVASAMATELGTMRVTEQIDAMSTMAVNPVQYLIVPRVLATLMLMPVLCMLFDFIGILGSFVVGVGLLGIDYGPFTARIEDLLQVQDIVNGLIKAAVFGLVISFVGCFKGYYASGGAKGVGEATTAAVVISSISILILDYFLTVLMWS